MEDEAVLFSALDYTLFFSMLLMSAFIGAYFGFYGKKQDSPKEYLHGGKNMSIFPIAASLIASDISGITLLATPTDLYMNGPAISMCVIATIPMVLAIVFVFTPVFYKLQLTSSYEYLKLRFSSRICTITSFIFAFISTVYLPIIIYIPALAFNQVSGIQLNIIIPVVCLICIFYTTVGGIKAVVWTDTLQMILMVGSLLCVFFHGVHGEGGFATVLEKAKEGGRLDYNFSADPTNKMACLTVLLGFTVLNCGSGSNPIYIQRFLSLPTKKDTKITAFVYCCGSLFLKIISLLLGLVVYAHYKDCSPLVAGNIKKPDQILPYYIMEVSSALPGLPGIFIAGLFSAALSTISSGLNTMAGTIYTDFIKCRLPKTTTDKRASDIMKLIVVVLGFIFIVLVFAVQYLGAIMQLAVTIGGIVVGPLLAIFTLGMLVPLVNEKGILCGAVAGLITVSWIICGAIYYRITGRLTEPYMPLSAEGCDSQSVNATTTLIYQPPLDPPMYIYRLSFYYYAVVGFITTVLITLPASILTGGLKQKVHRDLLSPIIYPLLSESSTKHNDDFEDAKELERLNGSIKCNEVNASN